MPTDDAGASVPTGDAGASATRARDEAIQPSLCRGEAALDGHELEQVVASRVVGGVLHQRGHPGEQRPEPVADRLELTLGAHRTMMAAAPRCDK